MAFDILAALRGKNGLLEGHFKLKSGRHAPTYINKDVLYHDPLLMREVGKSIAEKVPEFGKWPLVVLGPEKGGIILAQWTAYSLSVDHGMPTWAAYAEKQGEGWVIKRGMEELIRDQQVLLVEDVVTTGNSIQDVGALAMARYRAKVIGGVCLVNRGQVNLHWLKALAYVSMESWAPEECPLCKEGVPLNTNVGHAV